MGFRSVHQDLPGRWLGEQLFDSGALKLCGIFHRFRYASKSLLDRLAVQLMFAQRHRGEGAIQRFGHPWRFREIQLPRGLNEAHNLPAKGFFNARQPGAHNPQFFLKVGIVDPVVEATPFQSVAQLPGAVGSENNVWNVLCLERSHLRDADLKIRQQFEEKCLESLVGAIDLINQQHRRSLLCENRLEQGALEKELFAKNVLFLLFDGLLCFFLDFYGQQLLLIVPFVNRRAHIQTLVTLQPDKARPQHCGEYLSHLRLAQARVTFNQKRLVELHRQVNGGSQRAVGDISELLEALDQRMHIFDLIFLRTFWRGRHDDRQLARLKSRGEIFLWPPPTPTSRHLMHWTPCPPHC